MRAGCITGHRSVYTELRIRLAWYLGLTLLGPPVPSALQEAARLLLLMSIRLSGPGASYAGGKPNPSFAA
jgi:hypothetical protein